MLETPLVTVNPDGSTTIDNATLHSDGSLATETISTTSADGLTKTIAFDDAGNGIIDHRQTDDTVVGADGSKTETVSDVNGSGVLEDSTTTTTSADGSSVTINLDGSGIIGQSETRQTSSDMEALRDVFDTNHDGKLDAGDAAFAQFKLMVTHADGTTSVETLAQAGITSIDLTANSVTQDFADGSGGLTSSNQFVVGEDNYQHRTAWAGAGSAVLFVDPNGDNAIRNADQYVFSDWDPSA